MEIKSIPTTGRTLDYAASVYDAFEPLLLLGKQNEMNNYLISLLEINESHRILDIGCGTGLVAGLIADKLQAESGGLCIGIDAAGKMIAAARQKRGSEKCRFEPAIAEDLPFEENYFDSAISTLFYHHIDLELKKRSFRETFRVLKPGGKLIIADMHIPTTIFGSIISHASRWLLFQPQIGENIHGVLPYLIEEAGFFKPALLKTYFGYISVFSSYKPLR